MKERLDVTREDAPEWIYVTQQRTNISGIIPLKHDILEESSQNAYKHYRDALWSIQGVRARVCAVLYTCYTYFIYGDIYGPRLPHHADDGLFL